MATVSAPTTEKLAAMLGPEAFSRFEALCAYLQQTYSPQLAWHDGGKEWTYECKFRRGGKTIASLLADEGKAGLLLIFGKAEREKVEALRASLSPALLSFYDQAATYRDGKWALFPLDGTAMLEEVLPFLTAKRKPGGKKPAIAGEKLDFKKAYPDLYLPKQTPSLVAVPPMPFLMVDGTGDPAGECYQEAVQTLYALAFSIKMRKRTGNVPQGYVDYVVPPLEGLWWSEGGQLDLSDRSSWHWTAMIRQPDFVSKAVFEEAAAQVRRKKPEVPVEKARLEMFEEGLCVQAMHLGPYSTEAATMNALVRFARENGYQEDLDERKHHELYLSDPRRANPDRLKTVLRVPIKRANG